MTNKWYNIELCIKCDKRIHDHDRSYNSGICPKCGHDSNSTICDTKTIPTRRTDNIPWWKFWDRNYKYEQIIDGKKILL